METRCYISHHRQGMSNMRLFLIVLLVILGTTWVIVDWIWQTRDRTTTFETMDDVEARVFMQSCDGHVRIVTRRLTHRLWCIQRRGE